MFKNYKIYALTALLLASLVMPSGAALLSQPQAENLARVFLQQLDQGQQDNAWQAMSSLFQVFNDPTKWKTRQQVIRTSYGSLLSRRLISISYRPVFRYSPDGDYVVIQFQSIYQNKADSRETVVLDCSNGTECPVREYVIQ